LIVSVFFFLLAMKGQALDGSAAVQGGYVQALPSPGQNLVATLGFNCYLYFDINLDPSFALGLSTAYSELANGSQRLYVDGTLLNARWSPWVHSPWSPYLTAGVGLRPLSAIDSAHRWCPGAFQSQAGIGLRHPVFERVELDVTAFYNLNTSPDNSLSSVGVRAGLAFLIDFSSKKRPTSAKTNLGKVSHPVSPDKTREGKDQGVSPQ
jgi:hypothetical protein